MTYDLFSYPRAAGFKERTTSREAALKMKHRQPKLRDRVLAILKDAGPVGRTADECAELLGKTPFSIRPRLTELFQLGLIYKSGSRRPNQSRVMAIVWRVAP